MAYGKNKKRKSYKIKKYKRAKNPEIPKAIICYCPQVAPDVMRVQLKYFDRQTYAGGSVLTILDRTYRGNGSFDPDQTGIGGQPYGFDQWANFYRRYRVRACKMEVLFNNKTTITTTGYIVAQNTSAAISGSSGRNLIANQPYSKITTLGAQTGEDTSMISMYLTTAQVRGGPVDIVDYEGDLSSINTSTPLKEWYYHVGAYGNGTGDTTFEVDTQITITYFMEWYDRETMVGS